MPETINFNLDNCFAVGCHKFHNVIDGRFASGKFFWIVDAKTFFDISLCFIEARNARCKCTSESKCRYCKSISPGLYVAFYLYYKNMKQKIVDSNVKTEFTKNFNNENSSVCAKYCFEAEIIETIEIKNEQDCKQYMSDYAFE